MNPSNEQNIILSKLEKNNVIVNAVPGSGKTTTALLICKKFKTKNILIVTFNTNLREDTNLKCSKQKILNCDVHTYHSLTRYLYDLNKFTTDQDILHNINNPFVKDIDYDIIILDECQDMTIVYYNFIIKILSNNIKKNYKLCLLGDCNQGIFGFKGADVRYLTYGDKIFFNNYEFEHCTLSISYRLSKHNTEFINNCVKMKNKQEIQYNNDYCIKPTLVFNENWSNTLNIIKLIEEKIKIYGEKNIFILANSVKNNGNKNYNIIYQIESRLKKMYNISIYIGENTSSSKSISNKLVITTYYQVKGLEADCVFLLDFNDFYCNIISDDLKYCPPSLFVAMTRAKKELIIINNLDKCSYKSNTCPNKLLPFINTDTLDKYTNIIMYGKTFNNLNYNDIINLNSNCTKVLILGYVSDNFIHDLENSQDIILENEILVFTKINCVDHFYPGDILHKTNKKKITCKCIKKNYITFRLLASFNINEYCYSSNAIFSGKLIYSNSVTDFSTFISSDIVYNILKNIKINTYDDNITEHNIPSEILTYKKTHENISDITGKLIPLYYMYKNVPYIYDLTNQIDIWFGSILNNTNALISGVNIDKMKQINEKLLTNNELEIKELITFAHFYDLKEDDYIYKKCQISFDDYNWLTYDKLINCENNMLNLKLKNNINNFEVKKQRITRNVILNGIIDYIDDNSIYEFKTTKCLDYSHYIQLIIYAWMCIPEKKKRRYYLFNIVTNTKYELIIDDEDLESIVESLIEYKKSFQQKQINDIDFFNNVRISIKK